MLNEWRYVLLINVGDIKEARRIEFYIKRFKQTNNIKNTIKALHTYYSKNT